LNLQTLSKKLWSAVGLWFTRQQQNYRQKYCIIKRGWRLGRHAAETTFSLKRRRLRAFDRSLGRTRKPNPMTWHAGPTRTDRVTCLE